MTIKDAVELYNSTLNELNDLEKMEKRLKEYNANRNDPLYEVSSEDIQTCVRLSRNHRIELLNLLDKEFDVHPDGKEGLTE